MAAMLVLDASPLTLVRWSPDDVDEVLDAVRSSFAELQQWTALGAGDADPGAAVGGARRGSTAFDAGTDFGFLFARSSVLSSAEVACIAGRTPAASRSAIGCGAIDRTVATRPGQRKR